MKKIIYFRICEAHLAYEIGVAESVWIEIDAYEMGNLPDEERNWSNTSTSNNKFLI